MKALLGIVVVALLSLILWRSQDSNEVDISKPASERVLQAYMENFHMMAMDDQGKPALKMTARAMKQYSDSKLAELDNPEIELHDADRQWHIVSGQGLIDHRQQNVALENQVVLRQRTDNKQHTLEIHTQALDIDIDRQRASTDAAVTIIIDQARLQSTGMVLDNRKGTLQLLADVNGVIDAR